MGDFYSKVNLWKTRVYISDKKKFLRDSSLQSTKQTVETTT